MVSAKLLAQVAASSLLFYSLGGCSAVPSPQTPATKAVLSPKAPSAPAAKKYAVINTGASIRNAEEGLIDPIDKNGF